MHLMNSDNTYPSPNLSTPIRQLPFHVSTSLKSPTLWLYNLLPRLYPQEKWELWLEFMYEDFYQSVIYNSEKLEGF